MNLLTSVKAAYPEISFMQSDDFTWSPKNKAVFHRPLEEARDEWSLLHELGHGLLDHHTFGLDVDLLRLEVDAWTKAKKISKSFNIKIDDSHIERCIDTYRDWLHRRSTCPNCSTVSFQIDPQNYLCINCTTAWRVGRSRLCRVHRRQVVFKSPNTK